MCAHLVTAKLLRCLALQITLALGEHDAESRQQPIIHLTATLPQEDPIVLIKTTSVAKDDAASEKKILGTRENRKECRQRLHYTRLPSPSSCALL